MSVRLATRLIICFSTALLATALAQTRPATVKLASTGKPVDFQREIRPILSDNCFHCHGPDSTTRMAGLRLDQKAAALEARRNGSALVPGKIDASLLYKRMVESSPAKRMPPTHSHKTLTPEQISTVKRWIEQGANWQEHWAFQAPAKPALPRVRDLTWPRTPVDRFVLARLEAQGLKPAPLGDRRTLLRRVALDVTGLPPTPAEIELFLGDTSPQAYERMVDRYLASPHYGEHRARYWLDAARYGDTHGIHIDNYREIWPYRDWVIKAFNRNQSFDQFSIEQLAGDLLPNPTLDQRIATGFHRNNATTSEGGAIDDEYIEVYAKDRADTTAAVWLAMTVGCATCHDHKFDPILQKDFYALGAFFRNTPQRAMDGNVADTPPFILVPKTEDREAWDKVRTRMAAIRADKQTIRASATAAFEQWLSQRSPIASPTAIDAKDSLFVADVDCLLESTEIAQPGASSVAGRTALHFAKDEGFYVEQAPRLEADKPFSISTVFYLPESTARTYYVAGQQNLKDKSRGWVIEYNRGITAFRLIGDDGKGIEVRSVDPGQLRPGAWHQVAVSYDGSRQQSGLTLYLDGREVLAQGRAGAASNELRGSINVPDSLLLGRSLAKGAIADFRIVNRVLSPGEVELLHNWPAMEAALQKERKQILAEDRAPLLAWYLHQHHEPYRALLKEETEVNGKARKMVVRGAVTHVMHERSDSAPFAHILFRGAYDQKREKVAADTPSALPPMSADLPKNRLGFAKWLFTDTHPLTARVTVNRMWQEIFGVGLVRTPDDFGSQGEAPSHPELLDWLAVDFRENGWDVKRFYKQILLSAAYRQSAQTTPLKVEKDPDNRLLGRGPRFRMDAEVVRDYALAASGLLSRGIGGPSVRPYQPDGVWEAVAMEGSNTRFYQRDKGEGLYRRSMYTFWKRSAPPASLDIFNAPSRENCTVRRERTNTPLQALVTMNDVQFIEAGRMLAQQAMQSVPGFAQRLGILSNSILARPLTLAENQIVRKAFDDFQAYYQDNAGEAEKLLNTGERKPDPSLPAAEYAAFTMVANQLLNLDEVLNK